MKTSWLPFINLVALTFAAKHQDYPTYYLDSNTYQLHAKGDPIPISCIKRHIDTGEHIFDPETNEITYGQFPPCLENNEPLSLSFGVDEVKECTLQMDDELFHLFQLYLHKDAPWTCRLETKKASGVYVPFDISVRGNVLESHVDLDSNINMIIMSEDNDDGEGEIIAGTAWSASKNTTKVIIGDKVKFRFNTNWANKAKGATIGEVDKESITNDEGELFERAVKVLWLNTLRNKSIFDSSINVFTFFIFTFALGSLSGVLISYKRLGRKIQASNASWSNKIE